MSLTRDQVRRIATLARIALKGDEDRYVLQGVHMILEGDHQRAWKDGEKHESRLVFIGRDLDEDRLKKSFDACQAA